MAIKVSGGILSLASDIAERYEAPIPLLEIAEEELIRVICDDYGAMTFDGLTWFEAETDEFFIHLNTNKLKGNYPKSKHLPLINCFTYIVGIRRFEANASASRSSCHAP